MDEPVLYCTCPVVVTRTKTDKMWVKKETHWWAPLKFGGNLRHCEPVSYCEMRVKKETHWWALMKLISHTKIIRVFIYSAAVFLFGDFGVAGAGDANSHASSPQWTSEIIELASTLAIQDAGRVKPLDSYARFKLLKLNGRRVCYTPDGDRRTSLEWLLDCLFYPELVQLYPIFLVPDDVVLDAIGVTHADKKKRDRYSYADLYTGREGLFRLANEYIKIDAKDRSSTQAQIVHLAENITEFEWLTHYLDFATATFEIVENSSLSSSLGGVLEISFSRAVESADLIRENYNALESAGTGPDLNRQSITKLLREMDRVGSGAAALALFAPAKTGTGSDWLTPADVMNAAFSGQQPPKEHIWLLSLFENLYGARDNTEDFTENLIEFHETARGLADARGEYAKIPLEFIFYKGKFFYYSLILYILSFIFIAISWLRPANRLLYRLSIIPLAGGTLYLIAGIVFRCVVRGRPPVSTLYESVLFITAVVVLVSMFIEFINRQGIALSIATIIGTLGLFLANKYEVKEGTDTMTSLVAVLDSNFWLSTHVTTVTIGYAAGILAGAIAHIYILAKVIGLKGDDAKFYSSVARMVYGVICFGLLFSVVGTILGGIWANDSWGRFWGWDPKENGALMIILWELAILHARMGGYIRDLGTCNAAVFGACIVAFSWWGVNLLGIGLHSYGFTSGIFTALMVFYGFELIILVLGCSIWLRQKIMRTVPITT